MVDRSEGELLFPFLCNRRTVLFRS